MPLNNMTTSMNDAKDMLYYTVNAQIIGSVIVNVLLAASLTQLIGMLSSLHQMSFLKMVNL